MSEDDSKKQTQAVTVSVRSRPLSPQEVRENCVPVVSMNGDVTLVSDPQNKVKPLSFTFDHSFWSSGDAENDKDFVTQQDVYKQVGKPLVEGAIAGFNCCLFAYGQTGSGKTYCMMGFGEDQGVIPRLCAEMFLKCHELLKSGNWAFQIEVSYLEIYNEKCRCLLAPPNKEKSRELRLREHPITGPYVENLTKIIVHSYEEIEKLMEEGNRTRTVAATSMNATSSRSHAIFSVEFTQKTYNAQTDTVTEKFSRLNLVDLAGSERADRTGATGDTLKEASNINKSLTTLGKVINGLAEGLGKDGKFKKHVPFRDSALTWLLKENLSGNSKTMMLATISPADSNYDETVSTLRYADRAKSLKTTATVNEDPSSRKIKDLSTEIDRLRRLVGATTPPISNPENVKSLDYDMLTPEEKFALVKQLLNEEKLSWEEKEMRNDLLQKERRKFLKEQSGASKEMPSLVNLNEDPSMSECLVYYLDATTYIGCTPPEENTESDNSFYVWLEGGGILPMHAMIETRHITTKENSGEDSAVREVWIQPGEKNAEVRINGKVIPPAGCKLDHGNRIIFGKYHVFRFADPTQAKAMVKKQTAAASLSATATSCISNDSFHHAEVASMDYQKALEERFEQERLAWLSQSDKQSSITIGDSCFVITAQQVQVEQEKKIKDQQLKLQDMEKKMEVLETQKKQSLSQQILTSSVAVERQKINETVGSPLASIVQIAGAKAQRLPPQQIFRYKIVLIGHQEVGKTSLRKCFQNDPFFFGKKLPDVQSTTGIEIQSKTCKIGDDEVEVNISDFAGQEAYHSHSLFMTKRSLFVLVWKISAIEQDLKSKGISVHEEERMCRWLNEVYAKFPRASVALCATHMDELRDQSQRSVEFILGKVEAIVRNYCKKIARVDPNSGKPIVLPLTGNFAVSCKNRTFVGAGMHKGLSGAKLSSLLQIFAEEAHRRCVNDEVFWGGAVPGRHIRLYREVDVMKKTVDKLVLPLAEYVHTAAACGVESDQELLEISQLMHSWDTLYMFHHNSLADNRFFFLHPSWMCKMAGTLFSFAHVLATPQHLRSIIGGLDYRVTEAENADMGLLSVGFLRFPLARVLFSKVLTDFVKRPLDDYDCEMCIQLLMGLELLYKFTLIVDDPDIASDETPGGAVKSEKIGEYAITRYFVPSLSPYLVPAELHDISPVLFNRGTHIRFDFNMLPPEMWWKIQFRVSPYIQPIVILVPKDEEEMEFLLPEACEYHNRWRDASWLKGANCRVMLMREGDCSLRLYSCESEVGGSEEILKVIEDMMIELLQEYRGVERRVMVSCPVQGCTGWHCVEDVDQEDAEEDKYFHCSVCHQQIPYEAVVVSGTGCFGPQAASPHHVKHVMELLHKSLDPKTVTDVCDFLGIRADRAELGRVVSNDSADELPLKVNYLASVDKIVHVIVMNETLKVHGDVGETGLE